MSDDRLLPPVFHLKPGAHRIGSDAEAVAVGHARAAELAVEAAGRDRERRLPVAELDRFLGSVLWGIMVPREHGGAEVSFANGL